MNVYIVIIAGMIDPIRHPGKARKQAESIADIIKAEHTVGVHTDALRMVVVAAFKELNQAKRARNALEGAGHVCWKDIRHGTISEDRQKMVVGDPID